MLNDLLYCTEIVTGYRWWREPGMRLWLCQSSSPLTWIFNTGAALAHGLVWQELAPRRRPLLNIEHSRYLIIYTHSLDNIPDNKNCAERFPQYYFQLLSSVRVKSNQEKSFGYTHLHSYYTRNSDFSQRLVHSKAFFKVTLLYLS